MKKQYSKKSLYFSIIGIWLLLAPMAIELYHSVNTYHAAHEICVEQTTHVHQTPVDCSICDFHLSFFTYSFLEFKVNTNSKFYYRTSLAIASLKNQNSSAHYLLRGPPLSE